MVEKKRSRGIFARGAQSSIDLADIKALVDSISSLLEIFQVGSKQLILSICHSLSARSSRAALLWRSDWV